MYSDIVSEDLLKGAIENNDFPGFREDYHVLHCLLRLYQPASVFEVGTNMGKGTSIICNALPNADVYSLDLPTELAHISLQHPISEGKGDRVGHLCKFPFTLLRGDSMHFDFTLFPCEAYFIDGEHDYEHPYHETCEILECSPNLIVWHDSDIQEVWAAINDALEGIEMYELTRVVDTRMAFAIKTGKHDWE